MTKMISSNVPHDDFNHHHTTRDNKKEQLKEHSIISGEERLLSSSPSQQVYCKKCHGQGRTISFRKQKKRIQSCPICLGTGLVLKTTSQDAATDTSLSKSLPYHVSIIGAGIGGLALGLALQQRNIPYTIYERDLCFEERSQGYGLTMQQGGKALNALGFTTIGEERLMGKGIHSKRHLVHTSDGKLVGAWGLKVWGRSQKRGMSRLQEDQDPQGIPSITKTQTTTTDMGQKGEEEERDVDASATKLMDATPVKEAKRQNVHIARQELRRLLYDQILDKDTHIRWGHKFLSYQEHGSSVFMKFQIQADHSSLSTSDTNHILSTTSTILVGADGIRSQVRAQKIPNDISPLRYLDCIVILGIASTPQSSDLTSDNETVFQTADGTTRLYAMPFSARGKETAIETLITTKNNTFSDAHVGETMWQLSFPLSENDAMELSSRGAMALKAEATNRVGKWHVPIPELIQNTPLELISGYPVYDRDLIDNETFRNGMVRSDFGISTHDYCLKTQNLKSSLVTLIGDAAHPMSPFKGQGANQALLDSVLLARAIHKGFTREMKKGDDITNAIMESELKEFEEEMLQRSSVKIQASLEAAKFLHTDIAITEGNRTRAAVAALSKINSLQS